MLLQKKLVALALIVFLFLAPIRTNGNILCRVECINAWAKCIEERLEALDGTPMGGFLCNQLRFICERDCDPCPE